MACMTDYLSAVRVNWAFEIVSSCQQAVIDLQGVDSDGFRRLFGQLAERLPAALNVGERLFLRDRLRSFAEAGGRHFHECFHRRTGACRNAWTGAEAMAAWTNSCPSIDPRGILREWSRVYTATFDRAHQWPPAIRAAAILRADFRRPLDLDELSDALACSRSVLTRTFRHAFGLSLGEFQTRLRTEEAMKLLSETTWSVDAIARMVGYQSSSNLYIAIKRLTGQTPVAWRAANRAPLEARNFPSGFSTFVSEGMQ